MGKQSEYASGVFATPQELKEAGINTSIRYDSAESIYKGLKKFFQNQKSEYYLLLVTNSQNKAQITTFRTDFDKRHVTKILDVYVETLWEKEIKNPKLFFIHNHPGRFSTSGKRGFELLFAILPDALPSEGDILSAKTILERVKQDKEDGLISLSVAPAFFVWSDYACIQYHNTEGSPSIYGTIPKLKALIAYQLRSEPMYKVSDKWFRQTIASSDIPQGFSEDEIGIINRLKMEVNRKLKAMKER